MKKKVITFKNEQERMAFVRKQYRETPIEPMEVVEEEPKPKGKKASGKKASK